VNLGLVPDEDFVSTRAITYLKKNALKVGDDYVLIDKEVPIV